MRPNVKQEDIKEFETYLWVKDQLNHLERFVRSSEDGEDFIDLIEFLKQDSEDWCNKELLREWEAI